MEIVPNGESVAAPESGMQLVMPVDDGSFVARLSDGSTQVFGEIDQPVTTYILTMETPRLRPTRTSAFLGPRQQRAA